MSILRWEKPPKEISVEAWRRISADEAPPGVHTPNMSKEWAVAWKAKLVGAKSGDLRVELRKTFWPPNQTAGISRTGYLSTANCVIIVRQTSVMMSLNATAWMSMTDYEELVSAIDEASVVLATYTIEKHRVYAEEWQQ